MPLHQTHQLRTFRKIIYFYPHIHTVIIMTKAIHQGRNVKRIREILGVKQDALAMDLNLSQQTVSKLEEKESIDDEVLQRIADALKVPVEAIENFSDDMVVNVISNTFTDNQSAYGYVANNFATFNPLDKLLEVIEENKKLYERLIQSEKEQNELLKRLLDNK